MLDLAEPIAALRHGRFARHAHYLNDAGALAALVEAVEKPLTALAAGAEGGVEVRAVDGEVRAFVLWWTEAEAWHGAPAQHVWVDHDDAPESIAWTLAALDRVPRTPSFECHLDVGYAEVRRHLLTAGLAIDSITMLGAPEVARPNLGPARPLPPGWSITPLGPSDIDAVLALRAQVFTEAPEFCWFGANEGHLRSLRAELEAGAGLHEVVRDGDRIVGCWGTHAKPNPYWGPTAGMDVVLARSAQGRGIIKHAYHRMLSHQLAEGARVFKGGTAQPAVMHLGRRMGRAPLSTWIRAHRFFGPDHFAAVL